jgi:hypothetical protein
MSIEKAVEYVILLNIEPEKGKNLSPTQVNKICERLQETDLDEVKRCVTTLFHAESEQNKAWAERINRVKPINKNEQAEMIKRTHEIADKIVRVYNNLDEIAETLRATKERNSPTKDIHEKPKKRFSLTKSPSLRKLV